MRKLLLAIALLIGLGVSAQATTISVQSQQIPNWQVSTSPPVLRIFLNQSFVTSNGVPLQASNQSSNQWYLQVSCTLIGNTLTIPLFTIDSTVDGQDVSSATYTAVFFTAGGTAIKAYDPFINFKIPQAYSSPSGCTPSKACMTWADIRQYNFTKVSAPNFSAFTKDETINLINSAVSQGQGAPSNEKFIVQMPDITKIPNAQDLASLSTGLLKSTTGTGVLSIAVSGTDYLASIIGTPPITIAGGNTIGIQSSNLLLGSNLSFTAGTGTGVLLGTTGATISLGANVTVQGNSVTGTLGSLVASLSPALVTPNIGVATATSINGLTGPVTPNAAGGTTLGSAALPFSGIYIGPNITNNVQILTGAVTGPRTMTLPDANSNPVQPAAAPSNQFATAISAAGVISFAQPILNGIANPSGNVTFGFTTNTFAATFGNINGTAWTETYGAVSGSPSISEKVTQDTTGDTNTGPLYEVKTVGTSTAIPLKVTALGNGAQMDNTGIWRTVGTGGFDAAALVTGTLPSARVVGAYTGITQVGTLTAGTLGSGFTIVTPALGGTGANESAASGVFSFNAGVAVNNAITINGVAYGIAGNGVGFTAAAANGIFLTNGSSVPVNGTVSADLTISGGVLAPIQGIQTTSTPQFARLGLGQAAPAITVLGVTGATITTAADQTAGSAQFGLNLTKNDVNSRTFYDVLIKSIINPGGLNTSTTVNVLQIDTVVPGAGTGVTTNLIRASYAGVQKYLLDASGNGTFAGTLTATGGIIGTTISGLTITTSTGTLTVTNGKTVSFGNTLTFNGVDGKTVAFNNSITFAGVDSTTQTFQASDTILGRATTDTLTNKTITSSTDVLGGVTMTLGSDATGDVYYRAAGGALTRLGIGSAGQFIGVSGGLPAWATPAGTGGTINSGTTNQMAFYSGSTALSGNTGLTTDASNDFFIAPSVQTSGSPNQFKLTGAAHTTLAQSLEAIDVNLALNRTVQFTGQAGVGTANITTQRAFVIQAPTYAFSAGTQTITNPATFAVTGGPAAGTNAIMGGGGLTGEGIAIWSQSGMSEFDYANMNMNPTTPHDTPVVNFTFSTQANGVATTAQRAVGLRIIGTSSGTNTSNALVGIVGALRNIGSASENAFFAGDTYNKLGGNAYVLHGVTHDVDSDSSGTTAANLYGIVSTVDRRQTVSSSNFVTAFQAQASTLGGGAAKKVDVAYGFWGGGSFDYMLDQVRNAADTTGGTPQTINNALIRSAHGTVAVASRNQANGADVNLLGLGALSGINNVVLFGPSATTTSTTLPYNGLWVGEQSLFGLVNTFAASGTLFGIQGADGAATALHLGSVVAPASLRLIRADGASTALTAVLSGEHIGNIQYVGYDGTNLVTGATIRSFASENWTNAPARGADLRFLTTPLANAGGGLIETLRAQANGGIQVNLTSTTPVIGDILQSNKTSVIVYMSKTTPGLLVFLENNAGTMTWTTLNIATGALVSSSGATAP